MGVIIPATVVVKDVSPLVILAVQVVAKGAAKAIVQLVAEDNPPTAPITAMAATVIACHLALAVAGLIVMAVA